MIDMALKSLAPILGLEARDLPEGGFDGVVIDSRVDCAGRLFVAIRGENFDGHQFVDAARRNGAVAALVEKRQPGDTPQIEVADCRRAMGLLATAWRRERDPLVIALTGSNGKTTVKEMLYRIMSRQGETLATRGNLNNDLGVPLTLLELGAEHRFAIVEMGANHRGEIAALAEIAEPDIVYVNNAAAAHLEGFGDLRGVIEAKGELYAYCGPQQQALFNADDDASEYWRGICAARRQLSCAIDADADVRARWRIAGEGSRVEFDYRGERRACDIAAPGEHNARNALAAVSLALLAGVEFADAVDALDRFSGVRGRLQILCGPGGSRLIDDSYNANPDSLRAGVSMLCALPGSAWLALGDMAELGERAEELHVEAARDARRRGVEKWFGLGRMSCAASREFGDSGYCFESVEEMARAILSQLREGVNLLVKGSRAAGMERLVELLNQSAKGGDVDAV